MLRLARPIRPRRAGEWTEGKAVTFIVTLAANRSVTLAAKRAGMSRKAAYALKRRDAGFAAAWNAAILAAKVHHAKPAPRRARGNKVGETNDPRGNGRKGYSDLRSLDRMMDSQMRDIFYSIIANRNDEVAPRPALP